MAFEFTDANFKETVLEKEGVAVIDFWAEWCGPCKASMPAYEKASEENPEISFVKANVDEARDLAGEYGIRSIPTFIYFENGKEVKRKTGAFRNITELVS